MANGYWVVRLDVTNPEHFKQYQALIGPFLPDNGGRFLVRGGEYQVPEGQARARTVVVEFATYDAALKAYNSAHYQDLIAVRRDAGTLDFVIVEGYDG